MTVVNDQHRVLAQERVGKHLLQQCAISEDLYLSLVRHLSIESHCITNLCPNLATLGNSLGYTDDADALGHGQAYPLGIPTGG